MLKLIKGIAKCQKGATAVEYGLIVSLIVIAIIASLSSVAKSTNGMWNNVSKTITNATG